MSRRDQVEKIAVTKGQVAYEWEHFLKKMKQRSPEIYRTARIISKPDRHPLFRLKAREKEAWEK